MLVRIGCHLDHHPCKPRLRRNPFATQIQEPYHTHLGYDPCYTLHRVWCRPGLGSARSRTWHLGPLTLCSDTCVGRWLSMHRSQNSNLAGAHWLGGLIYCTHRGVCCGGYSWVFGLQWLATSCPSCAMAATQPCWSECLACSLYACSRNARYIQPLLA